MSLTKGHRLITEPWQAPCPWEIHSTACSLNVSGEEKSRALLIGGCDKDLYDLSTLLSHAQWVLREKRFSRIEPLKEPTLQEIESTLNSFDLDNTDQLFVYLVGPAEWDANQRLLFNLNPNETLGADMLDTLLDPFSSSPQVVLTDTPGAGDFFRESPNRIYVWSASSDQPAYLEQGGYCAFSHFFFTCLYWGASVYQAYLSSSGAIQYYSDQTPALFDGYWGQRAQATYIGSPLEVKTAGPRIIVPADRTVLGNETLWAEVEDPDPNTKVWALMKEPGNGPGETKKINLSWVGENRYEASYFFLNPGTYEVNTYVQNPNGLIDYDKTTYSQTGLDPYEDDDTPDKSTPFLINDITHPQVHNLHDPNDADWIILQLYSNRDYEVWADKKGIWQDCSLRFSLYSLDGNQVLDHDNTHFVREFTQPSGKTFQRIYSEVIPHSGFYLIRFFYGCSLIPQDASTIYEIVEITDGVADTGIIIGTVRHSTYNDPIPDAKVILLVDGETDIYAETDSSESGAFFLFSIEEGKYQIYADAKGYYPCPKIPIEIKEDSKESITLYLSPNPAELKPFGGGGYDIIDPWAVFPPTIQESYADWEKDYLIFLHRGMDPFSPPCYLLDCNSQCFLEKAYDAASAYCQGEGIFCDAHIGIRRYDSQSMERQGCFIDNNGLIHGECFDLDPYEGYLVYLDSQGSNGGIESLSFQIPCSKDEPVKNGYNLKPGMNLIGFHNLAGPYTSDYLLEDPDLRDKQPTILIYDPSKGSFSSPCTAFGSPFGLPYHITEGEGYILFIKEEAHDWQPKFK